MKTLSQLSVCFLLAALAFSLPACDLLNPPKPLPTEPVTEAAENEWVTFTRTALPAVGTDVVFLVHVEVTAKQELELLAVSEVLPAEFLVISGETTRFVANAAPGDVLELDYSLRTSSRKGKFEIAGFARAKPADRESLQLELVSPLEVR